MINRQYITSSQIPFSPPRFGEPPCSKNAKIYFYGDVILGSSTRQALATRTARGYELIEPYNNITH